VSDLRVLCLHGYHGSAEILRRQMAPLASSISGVEFVYVDAPSLAVGDFGWWHTPARGWDRTREWAVELFATQPRFDGVFGFSQGAACTGLLAGIRQEPGTTIRFDFAVMVGGFKNDAPQHAELYRRRLAVPSLHIIGHSDGVIPPNESEDLVEQFENPIVLYHTGGHVIPADRAVVDGVAKFLERRAEQTQERNAVRDAR
jgi:pimeloyl-ACP methyl ester carboxylesterase